MKPGFYTIMAAQFLSSLADNALLIAAIALLREAQSAFVADGLYKSHLTIALQGGVGEVSPRPRNDGEIVGF